MMILVEETQQRMESIMMEYSRREGLTAIHTRINSILILLRDQLSYLGFLLSSDEYSKAYHIAMDEKERSFILQKFRNESKTFEIAEGAPVRLRFQIISQDSLCLVLEVPLLTPMKSVALVKSFNFPSIIKDNLYEPRDQPIAFLQLNGEFYVELDLLTFRNCEAIGVCSGVLPPRSAEEHGNCAVSQYFHSGLVRCSRKRVFDKRRFIFAGSTLFYSVLEPLRIRLQCNDRVKEDIIEIAGRGAVETPKACSMVSGKAIFPSRKPSKIFFMANDTLGPIITNPNASLSNQRHLSKDNALSHFMPKTDWKRLPNLSDHLSNRIAQSFKINTSLIMLIGVIGLIVIALYGVRRTTNCPRQMAHV